MDLHRPSVHTMDRRRFLTALGFSAAAVPFVSGRFSVSAFAEQTAVSSGASPAVSAASGRLVLLSDTHVGRFARYRFTVDWLIECVSEISAMDPRPAHVLIYGDLSFNVGELGDYRMLREIFKPLDDAGIPWTPCMGNHDRRETFSEIFPEKAAQSLVPGHLVFKAETEYADFIMLDSLNVGKVGGKISDDQKDWLNETLKKQTKPTIVGAHHPLRETQVAKILESHSCVAGYINGHWHYWHTNDQPTKLPNMVMPSSGLWGDIGMVHAELTQDSANFTLALRDSFPKGKVRSSNVPGREEQTAKKNGLQWRLDL